MQALTKAGGALAAEVICVAPIYSNKNLLLPARNTVVKQRDDFWLGMFFHLFLEIESLLIIL